MPLTSDTLRHRRAIPNSGPALSVRLHDAPAALATAPSIPAGPFPVIRRAAIWWARPPPHALRTPTAATGADLPIYVSRTK